MRRPHPTSRNESAFISMSVIHQRHRLAAKAYKRALAMLLALTVQAMNGSQGIASTTLSLDEAINTALGNNPALKQFQLSSEGSQLSIAGAETTFEISAQPLSGISLDDDGESAGFYGLRLAKRTGYGGEVVVRGVDDSLLNNDGGSSYSVSFSQALFRNAGALINQENVVRARQSHLTAQRSLEIRKANTVVSVVDAYERVLRLQQQLDADEQAIKRANSLLKLTQAKERLGRTNRIDTLRVQLQQGETESRAANSKEQLRAAKRALAELMGWNSAVLPTLIPAPLFLVHYRSLDEATETALANRLDYAQSQQDHEDALRATRIAKKTIQPALRLVAQYDYNDSDLFDDTAFDRGRDSWTLSLVSDTDFNRNREKIQYEQALLRQGQTIEDIRARYLAIGREVEQALLAYQRAHQQLDVLQGNLKHAEARLTLARKLFRVGRTDGFSVTDAEEAFLAAQRRWLAGRSEASVNGYRLLATTGTLVEFPPHLKPGAS